ncbi:hypothetical protein BGZ95_004446 [Linnemannia exigua]|uniref:Uncharacterized protein n=1 Tax=Linnemannia exigua TaxID=604196 RepID=A0AAD4D306_9FUNG|nr:hypothetical protein BGZ95_004446 [Linnemannia exigua]
MSTFVKRRKLIQQLAVSPPSSPSPTPSQHSPSPSTRTSPTPSLSLSTASTSSGEQSPAPAKAKRYFKWTGRVGLRRHDDELYDYYASSSDEGSDASSTSSTRKRAFAKNDDDDEEEEEEDTDEEEEDDGPSFPNMALANYDAGDLKTPAYSTHGTPGTAIRMMNGFALEGGSPLYDASTSTPTGPIDSGSVAPRKLSDYKGFLKAWAEIHEIAMFEEDLEYADGTETIMQFLDRMEERDRKSELSREFDQDINSGADFAEARYVSYPPVNDGDWGDTTDNTKSSEYCEDGNITPKGEHSHEQIQDGELSTLGKDAASYDYSDNHDKENDDDEYDDEDKDDMEAGDMAGASSAPADTSASA